MLVALTGVWSTAVPARAQDVAGANTAVRTEPDSALADGPRQDARRTARLRDKILGMLVGSAIGDALGAPTEAWPRKKIEAHYHFVVDLREVVREPSPEGTWVLNGPPGTTTDDTRWKKLIVDYLTAAAGASHDPAESPSARGFSQFIIDTQQRHFDALRAVQGPDIDAYVDGTHRLLWLQEWVRVSAAFLDGDISAYAAALNRFYGGDIVCAGLLFCPVIGAAYPGAPHEAYNVTFELDIFDIGYARDIAGLSAAMVAAALEADATQESILEVLWTVDPQEYFKSRLLGRVSYKLYEDARLIVHAARKTPADAALEGPPIESAEPNAQLTTAFELLDRVMREHMFHAAEIHLVNLTGILFAEWDFKEAMRFVISYGRDNDTTGAVTGAILGAYHGLSGLPPEWVDPVIERSRELGIDLEAMAERLTAIAQRGSSTAGARPQ